MKELLSKENFSKGICGEELSEVESRKVQVNMLNALAAACEKHGLRYYLSGGTLLGAIRHKGFIPWDDDIDLNIPRPDLEKLYSITEGNIDGYILAKPDMNGFSYGCESFRMYDYNTVLESYRGGIAKEPYYIPIFVDIFAIEGLPKSDFLTKLHYAKLVALRKMKRVSYLEGLEARSLAAHIFHIAACIPAKLIGYKRWAQMIQKVAKKYDFDKSEYVGVMTAPVHTTEEKVLKKEYIQQHEVEFEGNKYMGPKNYDQYLTQLYGDYMQMPPIEKQKSHHKFNMYRRK